MKTYVITNDWQIPFHDKLVIDRLFMPFLKWLNPYGFIWNGDIVDCYQLSEFSKNPLSQATLTKEVRTARAYMADLAWITFKAWLGGNHEGRIRRYLWKNAEKLPVDADETFESLFRPSDYGFVYQPYGSVIRLGSLDVTHGSVVRQHSGWSAKAHFDKRGGSVLIGHTHRLGTYYRTNARGIHAAYENGCLCSLRPEYVQDPDWQQGFSVVTVGEKGFFHVQQVPIINRRYLLYGRDKWER